MIEKNWKRKFSEVLAGIGLTDDIIGNMRTLEWLIEAGRGRVIACIQQTHGKGIRYTALEDITKIPRTSLIRILKELKEIGIIVQRDVSVSEPRREKVPMYFYNKKRFGHTIEEIVTGIMVISRDSIKDFRRRCEEE